MKVLILFVFIISMGISVSQANEGKELIDESCVKCHNDSIYKKPKRKITSFKSLKARVTMCNTNIGTGWFPDEEIVVSNYLNDTYYHYKK